MLSRCPPDLVATQIAIEKAAGVTPAESKAVVDRITHAFNEGSPDLPDELIAPEFVDHSTVLAE